MLKMLKTYNTIVGGKHCLKQTKGKKKQNEGLLPEDLQVKSSQSLPLR